MGLNWFSCWSQSIPLNSIIEHHTLASEAVTSTESMEMKFIIKYHCLKRWTLAVVVGVAVVAVISIHLFALKWSKLPAVWTEKAFWFAIEPPNMCFPTEIVIECFFPVNKSTWSLVLVFDFSMLLIPLSLCYFGLCVHGACVCSFVCWFMLNT